MKTRAILGIMLTLLLISMLTLAFNIQLVRAESTDRKVGVNVGYWIQYGISVTWESTDPNATIPQYVLDSQQLVFFSNVVQSVSGTNITFNQIMYFRNGTVKSDTYWVDVDSGRGSSYLFFIAANLSAGDIIYTGLGKGIGEINETITRTYLGEPVEVNHSNDTTSNSYFIYSDIYWNKATGVLYEFYMNHTSYTTKGEETYATQHTTWLYPIGLVGVARTWTVDDDGPADFHTIQEAINAASPGDAIYVKAGIYYENVVVNKTVSLIGENKSTTIIDGDGEGCVLSISLTQDVSLYNFTIQNGILGVDLRDSSYTRFRNVDLAGSEYNFRVGGTFIKHFIHDIGTSNTVNYKAIYYWMNKQDKEVPVDAGFVALINCSNIVVRNSNLERNWDGILFVCVRNSLVENVDISNTAQGLFLMDSSNNVIQGNIMTNNLVAIVLHSRSNNNNVSGNIIKNNEDGIYFGHSYNNSADRNLITNNKHSGIFLEYSRNNTILENIVKNNAIGVKIYRSNNNSIYHNNFVNNTQQVYDLSWGVPYKLPSTNVWDDGYPCGGNYWSDYTGVDLYSGPCQNETGSDDIGDAPYVIDDYNQDNYPLTNPWTPAPPTVVATADVVSNTLNLKSKGKWITCHIELPESYNMRDIDVSTILIDDSVPAEWGKAEGNALMVKFDRQAVIEYIRDVLGITNGEITLTITGKLSDGTPFEGNDTIKVMFGGDADSNGLIDLTDFCIWKENYGKTPEQCPPNVHPDFDNNELVEMLDFYMWRENFGATTPQQP